MNWKDFWNERGRQSDAHAQVGRLSGNREMIRQIAEHVRDTTGMKLTDHVLDVCCGNGVLTHELSGYCHSITGIDFSDVLIQQAKYNYPKLQFHCMDILQLNKEELVPPYDVINLYFSFQYFETMQQGEKVLRNLIPLLKPGGVLLLGDVPDQDHLFRYYNSFRRILQWIKQSLTHSNNMGKFWSEEELNLICSKCRVKGEKLKQPVYLPYAHYRMDYRITV
ncbi:MAG: class I SAM-dependent methyltransferase [Bacteroidia bacterium]